jgi:creatinine amidohydrolase/Fe(II)-dependent formamide hydrolase-like protein
MNVQKAKNGNTDPLAPLAVIRCLEIGPVRLEARRVTAPYRVTKDDREEVLDLVYRFEEDVFMPEEEDSLNLACMLSAQVALNYGLFCDEIVFHGPYDRHDRRFLVEMARNTAREIFVKRFLEPNPFLLKSFPRMSPVKLDNYLRARFRFQGENPSDGSEPEGKKKTRRIWDVDFAKNAVLSSGGKDSLLSFGLLKEIGRDVHPIFVNESGRHWFTALNAYRYFSRHVPGTARVWTNADRLFNWMLRHLPFVRQDFSTVRSDDYPIRLWTVAVFLFGVLPILRKRRIGRLVIGDEFDTTRRLTHSGITHYDGLYDQSRYFDNALTRYFNRKGWEVSQFSILRPLSELLIEKVLLERYPDLQALQVSCHAAHKEEDGIHPCGRCEKCRRIVGMLMALGGDPARCGYTPEQVTHCLKDLGEKEIRTESEGAEQLAFLLTRRGLIVKPSIGSARVRERPEVMKLRFDPERSPAESIPGDLRGPLYRIYLDHADGAVERKGRVWMELDSLLESAADMPYPYESRENAARDRPGLSGEATHPRAAFVLGELTWPEAEKRFKEVDVVLLPVGAIEQHGPHLPLDTDAFDAGYLALQVAEACSSPKPLVLPLIPYGVSYHHEDFSGTISISPDTLAQMVYEIGMSAAHQGITKLVIINGHGGNSPALHFAAQMINRDAHIFTCVDTGESSDTDIDAMAETPNDVHAGEIETSTTLAIRPALVRLQAAKKFIPRFSSRYLNFTSKRSVGWYAHTSRISPTGVLGDPTKASREKGRRMWELMIRNLAEFVEDIKSMSLDELYQKRY